RSIGPPIVEMRVSSLIGPPRCNDNSCIPMSHKRSDSSRVPSMSHSTARSAPVCTASGASTRSDIEVLRLRVVQHERIGGLLGMQLQLLGQLHPDPLGFEQLDQLDAVLEIRARAVTEREPGAAIGELEVLRDLLRILVRRRAALGERQLLPHPPM